MAPGKGACPNPLQTSKFILASRASSLALQQANWVRSELERLVNGCRVEILRVRTTGDRMRQAPLAQIGGKGLFTKEIEEALLDGRAHFAVHSLKDLPTNLPEGLTLAAIPVREDTRDALISRSGQPLGELGQEARVGTGSVRRAAQLKRLRPDLRIEPLRGNLDTRLRKLREGPLDAIVLAAAGLRRLGLADQITEYFDQQSLCPAVGQGALGIEARAGDEETLRLLAALEDPWARMTITAERSLLQGLGGGCQVPIAAYAHRQQENICLTAIVIRPDGSQWCTDTECSPLRIAEGDGERLREAAEALGRKVAENLLEQGAGKILQEALRDETALPSPQTP